jgi:hypothetical protein
MKNQNQNINLNTRKLYNSHLKSNVMKKQLFLLILAGLAGMNFSFGQTCGDALHPMAGKSYTYSVTTNPAGGTFNWYVTSDPNLLTGAPIPSGGGILIAGAGYNTPSSTSSSIDITWTAQAVAAALAATPTKFYLVVKYTTNCSDNLKPWIITPMNLFEITVENIKSDGSTYADICRSDVVSAIVDPTDDQVVYNYGENALYLKVTAKNFTTSWTPKIDMAALNASIASPQIVKSIEWSLTTTFTGTSNFDLTTGIGAAVPDKGGDNITSGTDEFIYIKIIVEDGKFEGTADQTLALNLSATDVASNPDVDVDIATCAPVAENDNMTQVLKARPSITSPNPTPFLTAK